MTALDFVLPDGLEATSPPPVRDGVRLLAARPGSVRHARFSQLGEFLAPGDLVVVNTSGTLAAAVDGRRADGRPVAVHFSTELDDGAWVVEVRPAGASVGPVADLRAGIGRRPGRASARPARLDRSRPRPGGNG